MESIQKRLTKLIRRVKDYSYKERLEKIELATLLERRMGGGLIVAFKIINEFPNYSEYFFKTSP